MVPKVHLSLHPMCVFVLVVVVVVLLLLFVVVVVSATWNKSAESSQIESSPAK